MFHYFPVENIKWNKYIKWNKNKWILELEAVYWKSCEKELDTQ